MKQTNSLWLGTICALLRKILMLVLTSYIMLKWSVLQITVHSHIVVSVSPVTMETPSSNFYNLDISVYA